MVSPGLCWSLLVSAGLCWSLLVSAGVSSSQTGSRRSRPQPLLLLLLLHQALQVGDVPDGGPERLHLAEPLVGAGPREAVPQRGVAPVHAAHALALALVPLLDEGRLQRALEHAEVSVVVEGAQVGGAQVGGQQPGGHGGGGVQQEGHGAGEPRAAAVLTVTTGGRRTEAQVGRRREGGAHPVT